MSTTLTERYVAAVGRRVPQGQRAELEREVRALVDDAADVHRDQGSTDPERDAIVQLGDPDRLAATYTDRPLQLVGPELYPQYRRFLAFLYAVVLPVGLVVIALGAALAGASIGGVIGTCVGVGIQVAVHIGFWTTLLFAVLERTAHGRDDVVRWTPEMLPAPSDASGRSDPRSWAIVAALWSTALVVATVWQQFATPLRSASGRSVPAIDPALWRAVLPVLLAVLVARVVVAVASSARIRARGRAGAGLVWTGAVLDLAVLVPVGVLALAGRLVDPAVRWAPGIEAWSWFGVVVAAVALAGVVLTVVRAWTDGRRV